MEELLKQDDDILTEFAYTETLEKAKQQALQHLSTRMRTKAEMQAFLSKKGYDTEQIEHVITFLLEYQYLDDAAYCRAWIHDRIQFHPCGRQKMAFELAKKVSDRQLVQQSLEAYFPLEEEFALAQQAAAQKQRSRIGKTPLTREQLARFLYSRGYNSNLITKVLDRLTDEENGWQ